MSEFDYGNGFSDNNNNTEGNNYAGDGYSNNGGSNGYPDNGVSNGYPNNGSDNGVYQQSTTGSYSSQESAPQDNLNQENYADSNSGQTGSGDYSSYEPQDTYQSDAYGAAASQQTEKKERVYDFYEVTQETAATSDNRKASHHKYKKPEKKIGGIGRRFGVTITSALVFGLVAGLVFQGVNLAGNKVIGNTASTKEYTTVESVTLTPSTSSESTATTASSSSSGTLSVADIAQNVMPSVVAITAISVQEVQSFFGQTQQYEGVGSGSGIIIGQNDDELLIATNNHVVADAVNLSVSFYGDDVDGSVLNSENYTSDASEIAEAYAQNSVSAQIKGTDEDNDLAVVAVKKEDIPEDTMSQIKIATMGSSDDLVVGEQVVAIGNALGYGQSVTSGYVSALNRTISTSEGSSSEGLIQTDAAINPGNSGGALLNMKGEVIGINSSKFADESVEGMGFAIPVATAEPILSDLMNRETRTVVDEENAAYMGISCKEVSAEVSQIYMIPAGIFVAEVTEGGAADKAGIQAGDVITKLDGVNISSYDELTNRLQYYAAGETVEIVVERADSGEYKEVTLSITFDSKPDTDD
jgi:serine protease Do